MENITLRLLIMQNFTYSWKANLPIDAWIRKAHAVTQVLTGNLSNFFYPSLDIHISWNLLDQRVLFRGIGELQINFVRLLSM